MTIEWITRWNDTISSKPVAPGVWKRKAGGFRVRGRTTDPRTGKRAEVNRSLPLAKTAKEAFATLQRELSALKDTAAPAALPQFKDYAVDVLERKLGDGTIWSEKGVEKWKGVLRLHLIPTFGDTYLDRILPADVEAWKAHYAKRVHTEELSPRTVNGWLSIMQSIMEAAVADFDLARNPVARVKRFKTTTRPTYTEEEPNSLLPADVPRFLETLRRMYPQHYAMVYLGFVTGWRPSSLRPLRRCGRQSDVNWQTGVVHVRRSHTRKQIVANTTKTEARQSTPLPPEALAVLKWHVESQLTAKQLDSDLLFPSVTGDLRTASGLDDAFRLVGRAIKIPYKVTPRAMRRTFQDLARSAGVSDLVTRAVSGHATETMQRHYSTVADDEVRSGLAKVIDLASYRGVGDTVGDAVGSEVAAVEEN